MFNGVGCVIVYFAFCVKFIIIIIIIIIIKIKSKIKKTDVYNFCIK